MKNKNLILLVAAFLGFAGAVQAQLTSTSAGSNVIRMKTTLTSAAVDSVVVTNTGSGSLYVKFDVKTPWTIQALITKASGTLGGTMTLYGSNDGVNWIALTDATSAPTIIAYTVTDTGTYAAPQTKTWYLGAHQMKYYKLTHAGTGTMVGRFKALVNYN